MYLQSAQYLRAGCETCPEWAASGYCSSDLSCFLPVWKSPVSTSLSVCQSSSVVSHHVFNTSPQVHLDGSRQLTGPYELQQHGWARNKAPYQEPKAAGTATQADTQDAGTSLLPEWSRVPCARTPENSWVAGIGWPKAAKIFWGWAVGGALVLQGRTWTWATRGTTKLIHEASFHHHPLRSTEYRDRENKRPIAFKNLNHFIALPAIRTIYNKRNIILYISTYSKSDLYRQITIQNWSSGWL